MSKHSTKIRIKLPKRRDPEARAMAKELATNTRYWRKVHYNKNQYNRKDRILEYEWE